MAHLRADPFRSPQLKEKVVREFNDEVASTIALLKNSGREGKKQRARARKDGYLHRKLEKEHLVAKWDIKKSGNLWQMIPAKPRLFKDEDRLDAVEGEYKEPVRRPRPPPSAIPFGPSLRRG